MGHSLATEVYSKVTHAKVTHAKVTCMLELHVLNLVNILVSLFSFPNSLRLPFSFETVSQFSNILSDKICYDCILVQNNKSNNTIEHQMIF